MIRISVGIVLIAAGAAVLPACGARVQDAAAPDLTSAPAATATTWAPSAEPAQGGLSGLETTVPAGIVVATSELPAVLTNNSIVAVVEVDACDVEITVPSDSVGFAVNSADLGSDSAQIIQALAALLVDATEIAVVGHSSSEGDLDHNLELSQQRAQAVATALGSESVLADTLTKIAIAVDGVGPSQPVASNESETGRIANRRVVITARVEQETCSS